MRLSARRHRKPVIIFGTLIAVFTTLAVAVFAIDRHPRFLAEHVLAYELNRPVSIGALRIGPGNPIRIDVEDIHLGNTDWGTETDMMVIGHLEGELDPESIFRGPLRLRHVVIDDASLLLERNPEGGGNWHFGDGPPSKISAAGRAEHSRKTLPTMLGLAVHRSQIRMHTSKGALLKIAFADFDLRTDGDDQPVAITVDGKYNDIPVHLDITAQPFAVFHDSRRPFGVDVSGNAATASITLTAGMMDPLNFEGVKGQLHVDVKKTGNAAALFGAGFHWDVPLAFDSALDRNGDIWNFNALAGEFGDSPFGNSHIKLVEGKRLEPDDIQTTVNFSTLNLQPLLAGMDTGKEFSLPPLDKNPAALVDAVIGAKMATSETLTIEDLNLRASLTPGAAAVKNLSMSVFGGRLHGSISAKATDTANDIDATATLRDAELSRLLQTFHVDNGFLAGKLDAAFTLGAAGGTMRDLKSTSRGSVVLSMNDGRASKQAIQLASLDLKALLHSPSTSTMLDCLLAVVEIKNGIGSLAPFRMKTADGTLLGDGQIDLSRDTLDLTFQTDKDSTSASALDKPIHVSGNFDGPSITPLIFSTKDLADRQNTRDPGPLPSALQSIADANPCNR